MPEETNMDSLSTAKVEAHSYIERSKSFVLVSIDDTNKDGVAAICALHGKTGNVVAIGHALDEMSKKIKKDFIKAMFESMLRSSGDE
jgi:hypothetical protein